MRDSNSLLPLALVALLLGGFAYLPRSAAPPTSRDAADARAARSGDEGPPTRSEIELVADYFALDIDQLGFLRAVRCARDLVAGADAVQREQFARLMTPSGGRPPEQLADAMDLTLALAGVEAPPCGRAPADVLRDYLGSDREGVQLEVLHERVRDRASVAFLVALVPDPIDSNGRWQFDPLVDALQRATAESGYVLDRFALPDWDPTVDPERRTASERHAREPGAILFRRAATGAGRDDLLVVFLVYETATAGVHQEALGHAVATTLRWERLQQAAPEVRLLGPTYSGSVSSIRRVLAAHVGGGSDARVRIVSGGATSAGNRAALEGVAPGRVSYRATVLPDTVVLPALGDHIASTRRPAFLPDTSPVAVLVEGNTSWGKQASAVLGPRAIEFPFPLHISRLRSVTSRERPLDRAPAGVSRFLPLTLDDPITPADQVPSLSPRPTATSVELVVANLLSTIRREAIQTVGILATDTRDKLFLAQQISQFSPDVAIFTTEPDLLFTHPDYRRYTRGLIVGSTYPLFNGIQPASMASARRLQFGSMTAQGVYNAALALLDYDEAGVARAGAPELVDYGEPNAAGSTRPPLWIGVVGRGAIWPVRYVPVIDDGSLQPYQRPAATGSAVATRPHLSPWLLALFVAIVGGVVHHAAPLRRLPVAGDEAPRLFGFRRYARDDAGFEARSPYLLACLVSLLPFVALGAVLSGGALAPDPATRARTWAWWWAMELGWGALAVILLKRCADLAGPIRAQLRRSTPLCRGVFTAAALLLATVGLFGMLFIADVSQPAKLRAFVERAGQPSNGVSPVLPLVMLSAGLYFWASAQLQRLWHRSNTEAFAGAPSAVYGALGAPPFRERLEAVRSIVREPVSRMTPRLRLAAAAGAILPVLVVIARGGSTTEHWTLGAYFLASWAITQGIVAVWLAHVLDLWQRVRDLLRSLSVDAVAPAFGRMPMALFSDRFAVNFPGARPIRRIGAEAALLQAGLDAALGTGSADAAMTAAVPTAVAREPMTVATPGTAGFSAVQLEVVDLSGRALEAGGPDIRTGAAGARGAIGTALASMASAAAEPSLEETWVATVAAGGALHAALAPAWTAAQLRSEIGSDQKEQKERDAWLMRAQTLAVMPVAVVLREVLARVTQTLFLATGGVLLMVGFLASMPVQSRQTLVGIAWLDVFALSVAALTIFVQADRDELLSRLTGTDPGKVTWDAAFFSKLLLYIGIPLLTLFVSQFPELTDSVGRWLQPMQQVP